MDVYGSEFLKCYILLVFKLNGMEKGICNCEKKKLHLTLINHFHSMSMISLIFVIPSFFFLPTIYCETFVQKLILLCFNMFKKRYVFS
jgi:hypothetical protein